ncbi:Leucyl-tRNA synthetase [Ignavibacterium album JCM 16511]|uniref:Leucine--tRNA ligase n=1 Tax=Ignavibacterium album (strain DSM 19864 / JCM 16511 / NBRC 101810 / Mat9-16) TaxID=945713 RepID=I0AMZ1_IGNAJ|nr:leucine--tRNA ligase [Ignavibacterium album]AFH50348.1 Leucyl-tRNA synthetase [Ignavibacterium album JCM 16511]
MRYPFDLIEAKWQKFWEENKVFKTDFNDISKKLYTLVMFIYPSGAKLHIGHWYNYGPTDSWARFKKLQGYNVFEPMGYDAFGLPAENYAIKTGIHPFDSTMQNINDIRQQLKRMGCMYDWDAELMTCVPEYYKWNQWIFLQMYNRGLAYRKNAPVNWCPKDQTVLANEQVQDGACERCGTPVIQKNLYQWFFKITDYAEELLQGLDKINWPEKTKTMQRNWIGKSEGAEVYFKVVGIDDEIKVFTTRPDTLFGVTYVVLAPEHPLVDKITKDEFRKSVEDYRDSIKSLTEIERTSTVKEKTGVPTGAFAINPVNGEKVPVWIADYALITYGTGAVMAVPAHDERDFEFASKFNLPIKKVILQNGTNESDELKSAFTEVGIMINSGQFNGLKSDEGIQKVIDYLEQNEFGKRKINYRLRDWLISRQRYWGTPIPIIHCPKCGEVPVDEKDLPVELPYDVDFQPGGESPLARNEKFINIKCPKCGSDAKRDPDTMDTFVDSSWYYLRYLNPRISDAPFDVELAKKWTPVDMYVGGAEHATMHLLYARFVHKFLRDIGLVNSDEPFQTLVHQGTITNQGAKMSKSKGNVVNPDDFTSKYGSDVFRMYLMFMGPYDQGGDWSDKGISGVDRFVQRTYELFNQHKELNKSVKSKSKYEITSLSDSEKKIYRKVNQTLKKFNEEIENFRFNTAIASLMELLNELKNLEHCNDEIKVYALERFAFMLAPVAPHLGEECWQTLGKENSIYQKPVTFDFDKNALIEDTVNLAVQVNGKLRATIEVPLNSEQEAVKPIIFADGRVMKFVDGKKIVKEIFVKNKIYNIVVKEN